MNNRRYALILVVAQVWPLFSLHAQWGHAVDVQTPVSALSGVAVFDSRVIPDGSGGMFVVWEDRRNSDTLADIYIQRVGSDGRQKWTKDGVEVCRFEFLQQQPQIVADGAGGCIVIWLDGRIFNDGRTHVYAQRFDANGNALWTANGIRVCTNNDDQDTVSIVSRAGGGAVIVWSDQRADPGFRHIYAQELDLDGNRLLTDTGLAVATDNLPHLDIVAVSVTGGDTMVLWRGNFSVIKAVLLSDPGTVINAFQNNSGTRGLRAISDEEGGVIAGVYRFSLTSGDVGVWVQRISSSLTAQWGVDGALLSDNTGDDPFSEITLAGDGEGGAYVAWHTEPGNNKNIYAHRVSSTGVPLWASGGIVVAEDPEDEEEPRLLADDEGVYVFWRADDDQALRAQRYDPDGTPVWAQPVDVAVEEGINALREYGLVTDGEGGVVIGFSMFPLGDSLDVAAKKLLADGTFPQSRLINISTRAFVGTDAEQLIGGFAVLGTGTKRVLIRGVGPSLGDVFNLPGVLSNPMITVYDRFNNVVAQNNDWGDNANVADIQTVSAEVFAFSLTAGSADAVLLLEVTPGTYTVIVGGVGGETGVALVEIYDAERGAGTARLANISSRGYTGLDAQIVIAGYVILGDATMRVLVRGIGETIGTLFGVPGVVEDTAFELRNQNTGVLVGSNDDWSANAEDQETTLTSEIYTYAFLLPEGSKDAAKVFILNPGQYTALVSGVDSTTGVCLVEAYESF